MACIRGDPHGIRRMAKQAKPMLGPGGRKHCVFASIRSGSCEALNELIKNKFAVPLQSLVYLPKYIDPGTAYRLGTELIRRGASARQCSWTHGSVIMVVLPFCWHPQGVSLLHWVIASGGRHAINVPEHSPARNLKTATPAKYAVEQASLTGNPCWVEAAIAIEGSAAAVRLVMRLPEKKQKVAVHAMVRAGVDPIRFAKYILAIRRIPRLFNGPTSNPFLPARVKQVALVFFWCMAQRKRSAKPVLPYDVMLHAVKLISWEK